MTAPAIEQWLHFMSTGDSSTLANLLDEHAVFSSPAVFAPQTGRSVVAKYLRAAETIFSGTDFRYVGSWYAENSVVLEFSAEIDGVHLNGVDIITWNVRDQITSFTVMVRPLRGLQLLVRLMGDRLTAAASGGTSSLDARQ
ncbi:polyketide cyclase [Mycolicibacterium sp. (ex Dasyatis americana)]|nr:polyketide cyclase [Mycolicibacterium sp. (ex Dasyatis americana)]